MRSPDKKELNKILANYGFHLPKTKLFRTSGNIAYVVKSGKKKYFLRLCPAGARSRSKKEIAAEIELLKYLHRKKNPVILPIAGKNGKEIISWEGRHGYLREFLKNKEKLNPNFLEVRAVGRLLGRMHFAVKNYKTKNPRLHRFDLPATKKSFAKNKNKILKAGFGEFAARFEKEICALRFPKNLPKGMLHEDFGKRHILWKGGKITAVIDFDRAYFGPLILDLGQAARGWCFDKNWKKWDAKKFRAFISGYESERKLSVLEKKYLIDAIKFGCLERALSFLLNYIFGGGKKYGRLAEDELFNLIPQIKGIDN